MNNRIKSVGIKNTENSIEIEDILSIPKFDNKVMRIGGKKPIFKGPKIKTKK